MATDMFLKIDHIKGESQDAKHKDEITVLAWTWGLAQPGTAHSGMGAGSVKVSVRDLTLVKHTDRATPILMKMCCSGKHFANATLVVRKAGGTPVESVRIVLLDGLVSGIKCGGGSEDELLTESVTLNFASFKVEYTPQTGQGLPGPVIPAQWNIARNSES
jgi:type VI secretion system secreted protein Hcp